MFESVLRRVRYLGTFHTGRASSMTYTLPALLDVVLIVTSNQSPGATGRELMV